MSWSFDGVWKDIGRRYDGPYGPGEFWVGDERAPDGWANWLNIGKDRFQLLPTEPKHVLGAQPSSWKPNYRGHTFQLYSDGMPTEHFLNYHHERDQPSDDEISWQKGEKR